MLLDLAKPIDAAKARAYLDRMITDGAKCELKRIHPKRTIRQNSYLHVCLAMFSAETGYTTDEAKW